jgi:acetyl esterase/lipase
VATNTVYMDATRPSHVLLPLPMEEEPTASTTPKRTAVEAQQASPPTPRNGEGRFTVIRDVRYGDKENGVSNLLDLYLPEDRAGKLPIVVAIHGGGLATGSKEMFRPKATELAKRGYAVAAVNYRLKPRYHLPTQIYDVKAANRWIRAHAEKYDLDPDRVGVLGGSAGATLAAIAGTSGDVEPLEGDVGDDPKQSSKVQAVVALAGVYREFPFFVGCQPPAAGCKELVSLCAPITHVSQDDPPFFLSIGDKDRTPQGIADHTRFHKALREKGVDSTLIIVPGAEHGECFDIQIKNIVQFLDKHLRGNPVHPAAASQKSAGSKSEKQRKRRPQ